MKVIKINDRIIGQNQKCCISFEPSATYTNFQEAKMMIKYVADSGADAVKFQTFIPGDAERLMSKKDITSDFTTKSGTKKESVLEALKRRELSKKDWEKLIKYAHKLKLIFISTPVFVETIDFLKHAKVDILKVSKGDVNNVLFVEHMAKTKLPIILDGREKFEDVDKAIKICEKARNKRILILHCPSGYPAENAGVHLNTLKTISQKYKYPVGFADHSPGGIMNYAAVALGASMLEKTITVNKNIEHVEHFMSLELDDLKNFVINVRNIEDAMGDPNVYLKSRVDDTVRRAIVAKVNINKNEKIQKSMLDFQRPANLGISCSEGFQVINKKASINISQGTFLQWKMLKK